MEKRGTRIDLQQKGGQGLSRREKGAKEDPRAVDSKNLEAKKTRDTKPGSKAQKLKREYCKNGTINNPREGGALQLWQIQQTLGRGDFIEVTLSSTLIFQTRVLQGVLRVSVFRDSPSSSILAPISLARGTGHLSWRL